MDFLNANSKRVAIYSPRTTYKKIREADEFFLQELMLKLDPFTVSVIANDFREQGGQLILPQFIIMMKQHLKDWKIGEPNRELKLVRCLANLFDQIDLNLNGLLEWDELSSYVLGKATVLDNVKNKQDLIKYYTRSAQFKFNQKFTNPLNKLIYISDIDRVAFFEEGTDNIYLMNPENGQLNSKLLKIQPQSLVVETMNVKKDGGKGVINVEKREQQIPRTTIIIDMLYISDAKYQLLIVSSNDQYIRCYKYLSNTFVQAKMQKNNKNLEKKFSCEVTCMAWDNIEKILYCGLQNGSIMTWNIYAGSEDDDDEEDDIINSKRKQKNISTTGQTQTSGLISKKELHHNNHLNTSKEEKKKKEKLLEGGHSLVVMEMIPMPKLKFVASGALDGKLILWDTITYKMKREYKAHQKGITSLAFNESTILLFSAGFDHWIGVWNPYTDHQIYKITGHNCPLIHISVIQQNSQLICLDAEGTVKIRDMNKFQVNQSFSIESLDEKHKFDAQHFLCIPKPLRLFFSGSSIMQFTYDINYNPSFVDEKVAICCRIVPRQLAFYTPCGNRMKVWSILSGEVIKVFLGLTTDNSEITSFILDKLKKRMLIGDSSGSIGIFNAENGAKIKQLPRHQAEVNHILECSEVKMFVTASVDNHIHLTLDNDFGENELLRVISINQEQISRIEFYPEFKFLAVGTNTGQIAYFESETGKLHGCSMEPRNHEEITSLAIVHHLPFVIYTTSLGKINFMASPPLLYKFNVVESLINFDKEEISEPVGISHAVFCQKTNKLFITDDKLYLKCYSLDRIVQNLHENVRQPSQTGSNSSGGINNGTTTQGGGSSSQEKQNMQKQESAQFYQSLKTYTQHVKIDSMEPIWVTKAHSEAINNLDYSFEENLVITCSHDRKVKIWNALTGEYLETLQQNLERAEPQPIAYRRKGTSEIFNLSFEKRIDKDAKNELTQQHQQSPDNEQEQAQQQQKQSLQQSFLDKSGAMVQQIPSSTNKKTMITTLQTTSNFGMITELKEESESKRSSDDEDNTARRNRNASQSKEKTLVRDSLQSSQNNNINISESGKVKGNKEKAGEDDQDEATEEEEEEQKKQMNENFVSQYMEPQQREEFDTPEGEFNPFYYYNMIDPQNLLHGKEQSNVEWKLKFNFNPIYEEHEKQLQELMNTITKMEKKKQYLEIQNKHFHIVNFEVDPNQFDPNEQFRPVLTQRKELDIQSSMDYNTTGSNMDIYERIVKEKEKVRAQQLIQDNERQHVKKANSQIWENLHKNKLNTRNIDLNKLKEKVQSSQVSQEIKNATKHLAEIIDNATESDSVDQSSGGAKKTSSQDKDTQIQSLIAKAFEENGSINYDDIIRMSQQKQYADKQ